MRCRLYRFTEIINKNKKCINTLVLIYLTPIFRPELDDDVVVEDEENEFEHFNDEEEFEGFAEGYSDPKVPEPKKMSEPKLTVAKVPIHFRSHWDSYW
jgi:deferrochelatase/peroxidase EfeB